VAWYPALTCHNIIAKKIYNFNLNDRLLFTINIYFCVFEHVHYEIPKSQLHIITKMEIRILLDPTRHNYAILPTLLRLLRNSRKRQLPSPDYPVHLSQRLLVDT